MDKMQIARDPLNFQALAIEEAEGKIRETVQKDYFGGVAKNKTDQAVKKIIAEALKDIKIKNLAKITANSLLTFYNKQYSTLRLISPMQTAFIVALGVLNGKDIKGVKTPILSQNISENKARAFLSNHGVSETNLYGVPLQKFSKDYFDDNVKPVMDRLSKMKPEDNGELGRNYSLRGRAELEVRYEHNQKMVEDLKGKGTKLVICSTHADCSDRCARWQGKVFSLDGSEGVTDDGRKYIPLEVAQAGFTPQEKKYHNGLLGYNCRHYLVPYAKGFRFPKPNAKEERKQYAITEKQRALERNVLKWKTEALTNKTIDKEAYQKAKAKAKEWENRYVNFSRQNERAYYPSRIKVI